MFANLHADDKNKLSNGLLLDEFKMSMVRGSTFALVD